jgi:hypothetical protein
MLEVFWTTKCHDWEWATSVNNLYKVGYANALISICQAVPGAPYSDNKYNNSARS